MKLKNLFTFGIICFTAFTSLSQNIAINILTQNGGVVSVGGTVFVEVTVANTGATASPLNKIRPTLSVPASVTIPASGHTLPAGWSIVSNSGSTIRICNGTDAIPPTTSRTVLIAIQGVSMSASQTIAGSLNFSNGTCTGGNGPATSGDLPADNLSQTTVTVSSVAPVTLTDFNVLLINCQPVLSWRTETEVNSDRFEIERSVDNATWATVATVAAKGNTNSRSEYQFNDTKASSSSEKILYRLKMIDLNGSYKYSGVIQLSITCRTMQVSVYPNPVRDGKLYITLAGSSGFTDAKLMSVSGQMILKSNLQNGSNHLNISNIANGIYILNIKDGKGNDEKIKVHVQN